MLIKNIQDKVEKNIDKRVRKSREQIREETRQAILTAAWAEFSEHGFFRLSLEDVANRAGYSRKPIYVQFGSKENLMFELWAYISSEVLLSTFTMSVSGNLKEVMARLGEAIHREIKELGQLEQMSELTSIAHALSLRDDELRKRMESIIGSYIERTSKQLSALERATGGEFALSVEEVAKLMITAISGIAHWSPVAGDKLSKEAIINFTTGFVEQ